jgi:hypothetical protein
MSQWDVEFELLDFDFAHNLCPFVKFLRNAFFVSPHSLSVTQVGESKEELGRVAMETMSHQFSHH